MNLHRILSAGALMLALAVGSAVAQDKSAKRAEVQKTTAAALQKFYAKQPDLKAAVAQAPGYAVFTTYGVSFVVGGSGGVGAGAAAGGKGGGGHGGSAMGDIQTYTLTKTGLEAGLSIGGIKVWKDEELNRRVVAGGAGAAVDARTEGLPQTVAALVAYDDLPRHNSAPAGQPGLDGSKLHSSRAG